VTIGFRIPKEGAQMGGPADAPHPENALRFIDYLLRPAMIADIINAVAYPDPNLSVTALVKPEIRDDPAVYRRRMSAAGSCRPAGVAGL
jgi:putrescine transport system substrate-binding protein